MSNLAIEVRVYQLDGEKKTKVELSRDYQFVMNNQSTTVASQFMYVDDEGHYMAQFAGDLRIQKIGETVSPPSEVPRGRQGGLETHGGQSKASGNQVDTLSAESAPERKR